ncbi:MAG: hypothetical protein FWH21_06440 [Kiritimatiellaeota bacterium]|nr:hypothetical protein [Kiritimatiellota bacterium]
MKRMINVCGTALLGCALGVTCTGYAQKVDLLKPEVQAKELAARRFIESFGDTTIPYTVTVQKYKDATTKSGYPLKDFDGYAVTFPKDIQARLDLLDRKVLHDTLMDYFDDARHSFTVTVLMLEETTLYRPREHNGMRKRKGIGLIDVQALVKADKQLWNENFVPSPNMDNYVFVVRQDVFLSACYWSLAVAYSNPLYKTLIGPSYRYSVLMGSIPAAYAGKVFRGEDAPVVRADCNTLFGGIFDKYPAAFRYTAPTQIEAYPFITSAAWEEQRGQDTQKFLKNCRENDPASNPHLPALTMAMFTVDAYSFNDETGVYTMKERGKMLMDFIVEFPIPENATRLKAVMDGGNKDEIQAMMKKHNTEEKWKALLQNPVHPEFAKYPQD